MDPHKFRALIVQVRIHFIIEMIWWTGLAPWEFERTATPDSWWLSHEGCLGSAQCDPTCDNEVTLGLITCEVADIGPHNL